MGNQQTEIEKKLEKFLDEGLIIEDAYDHIVDATGLPRPTVRRCTSVYKQKITKRLAIINRN